MFCKNCGANIPDDARFCENCGTKVDLPVQPSEHEATDTYTESDVTSAYSAPEPQSQAQPQTYQPPVYQQPASYEPQQNNAYSSAPQYQSTQAAQPGNASGVKNFLAGNIIITVASLLCCSCFSIITGIIGIIFSSMSRNAATVQEAEQKANVAKILFYVSLGLVLLGLVINIVAGASGVMQNIVDELRYNLL